jgi:hypothetical protein
LYCRPSPDECDGTFDCTAEGTVRVFRQEFALEDAIGSHACSLEASLRVPNYITTVNYIATLKPFRNSTEFAEAAVQVYNLTLTLTLTLNLKVFLGQQSLFKGSEGGIGSYRLYVLVSAFLDARHGARFLTEIYTRGCHWIPRMFA